MFIWVALNENVKEAKMLWTITEICLTPKSLLDLQKSYPTLRNLAQTFPHGPTTWKDMRRNAWKDIANWRAKELNNFSNDDHQFKEKEMGSVGELSKVCSQIVLKCLYLACIGGPDVLWSVNKLVRAITKWTRACDKRLARLISFYIHHTSEYRQYCYVGNTAHTVLLNLKLFFSMHAHAWMEFQLSLSGIWV